MARFSRLLTALGLNLAKTYFSITERSPLARRLVGMVFPRLIINPSFKLIEPTSMNLGMYLGGFAGHGRPTAPYSSDGIYTTRFIVLLPNVITPLLKSLGLISLGENELGEMHEKWFMNKGKGYLLEYTFHGKLPDTVDFLGVKIERGRNEDAWVQFIDRYMNSLAHEYIHWLITRGTSVSLLVDTYSWIVRLQWMYLTNKFHEYTKYPRRLRDLQATKIDWDKIYSGVEAMVNDRGVRLVFDDMVRHYLLISSLLAFMVTLIVEPVTMPIVDCSDERVKGEDCLNDINDENNEYVESSLEELGDYFHGIEKYEDKVRDIFIGTVRYLHRGGFSEEAIRGIINIANRAINIPLGKLAEFIRNPDFEEIAETIRERFVKLLGGEDVEVAGPYELNSMNKYYYLINASRSSKYIIELLIGSVGERRYLSYMVRRIFEELGLRRGRRSTRGGVEMPQILALYIKCSDHDCKAPNLPYLGYLHEKTFGTLEELTSDYPLTMKIILDILISKVLYGREYLGIIYSCFSEVRGCGGLCRHDDKGKNLCSSDLKAANCDEDCGRAILGLSDMKVEDRLRMFMELWLDALSKYAECLVNIPAFQGIFIIGQGCD